MHVKVRTGLELQVGEPPEMRVGEVKPTSAAAILGRDFPGVKFDVLAEPSKRVRAGEPVLRDRHRPRIVFTAPISGQVASISRGARRALQSIQIVADDAIDGVGFDVPDASNRDSVRKVMCESGLWTSLRTRPYGHIPDPDAEPRVLMITAMDTEPLAPDPVCIISEYPQHFTAGIDALTEVCDAPLFVCRAAGSDVSAVDSDRVQTVEFSGCHPAGLPGTHIHELCPIGFDGSEVWYIGYQDVISLGRLISEGAPWYSRIVSLAGNGVARPRLLEVACGASVDEITRGEMTDDALRVISGSVLSGHAAVGAQAFLGQKHNQVTVIKEPAAGKPGWWRRGGWTVAHAGNTGPLLPTGDMEKVSPPGILPVPLMRALLVGDIDRARDLGALELVEEDLALLTYACPSGNRYGRLLRNVLDQLHKEAS